MPSLLILFVAFWSNDAATWPHLRGPQMDGTVAGPAFDAESLEFEIDWKVPLGASYSGVAVAEGVVVTALSDGVHDHVVALEEDSGEERWRHSLGPTYLGHDGSEDGPVSSPVIDDGLVYFLGLGAGSSP